MQFTGKAPTIGLSEAMRESKEHDLEGTMVLEALATNPAFQVRTVSGTHWICPFSGALIPCTEGSIAEIRHYLYLRKPWNTRRNAKHRPLFLILEQKWLQHLTTTKDAAYTTFNATGAWVHPVTGTPQVLPRARAATDKRAIPEIARTLAHADAQANQEKLSS